ncbi:hypothetical protein AB0H12_27855 [Actinosynnema sp. NPDC023794]
MRSLFGIFFILFGPFPNIDLIDFVIAVNLVFSAVTLGLGVLFAFTDRKATAAVRGAVVEDSSKAEIPVGQGNQPQRSIVDFGGLAKLAEALDKLNRSGRFLITSIAFMAVAVAALGLQVIVQPV